MKKHNDQVKVIKNSVKDSKNKPVELKAEGLTRKVVALPDGSIRVFKNGQLIEEA